MAELGESDGLARIIRDVCHIASGYRLNSQGNRTRISRTEQTDIARALCLDMGWDWNRERSDVVS